jgi:hypothetical protein
VDGGLVTFDIITDVSFYQNKFNPNKNIELQSKTNKNMERYKICIKY